MNCNLYVKAEYSRDTYYVPVRDKPLVSNLSPCVMKAILLLLDIGYFRTEENVSFEDFVKKIEEKKKAGVLSMPPNYYADNEEGISSHAFFRACNVLEYIFGFSQSLSMVYPLGIFAIKFE